MEKNENVPVFPFLNAEFSNFILKHFFELALIPLTYLFVPGYNPDRSHEKRIERSLKTDMALYEKMKEEDPDFYRTADTMAYGYAPDVPKERVDMMVNEIWEKCDIFSRPTLCLRINSPQHGKKDQAQSQTSLQSRCHGRLRQ